MQINSVNAVVSRVKALTQSQLIREGQTDLVAANMAKLERQALDLGATTQFTAVEAAQAMGFLGMAGWKTEQIDGTMPGMLDLAAAKAMKRVRLTILYLLNIFSSSLFLSCHAKLKLVILDEVYLCCRKAVERAD